MTRAAGRVPLILALVLAAGLALPKCEGHGSHPFSPAPVVRTAP